MHALLEGEKGEGQRVGFVALQEDKKKRGVDWLLHKGTKFKVRMLLTQETWPCLCHVTIVPLPCASAPSSLTLSKFFVFFLSH